jgi:hypothetical protein
MKPTNRSTSKPPVILAELMGSDTCVCEEFELTTKANAPLIELCRVLVASGVDPRSPLIAYRRDKHGKPYPSLNVASIGAAARLRPASHGVGFEVLAERTAGPPASQKWVSRSPTKDHGNRNQRSRSASRAAQLSRRGIEE